MSSKKEAMPAKKAAKPTILVVSYNGMQHRLDIRPNAFMLGVQQQIQTLTGIPPSKQRLALSRVSPGKTIHATLHKKGWCYFCTSGIQNMAGLIMALALCVGMALNTVGIIEGILISFAGFIWFFYVALGPRSDVKSSLDVSDAIFGTFSPTQVLGLARTRFNPDKLKGREKGYFDTIVIGSGIGGCTASAVHSQAGKKVLMLEQNERFGGCTHSFEMGLKSKETNCEFDTGLHYVSSDMAYPSCRSGALQRYITRGNVTFSDLGSPYDIVTFRKDDGYPMNKECRNNLDFRFFCGRNRLIEHILKETNPTKEAKILLKPRLETWFDVVNDAAKTMPNAWLLRVLPTQLEKYLSGGSKYQKMLKYGAMTTKDVQWAIIGLGWSEKRLLRDKIPKAAEWTDVEEQKGAQLGEAAEFWPTICRLCAVVTHPIGDYACQPRDSSFMAHSLTANYYLDGAAYTVGHTQGISTALVQSVLGTGGQAFCLAKVAKIIVKNGVACGVRIGLKGAKNDNLVEVYAKNVICATSLYNLYYHLIPKKLSFAKQFKREFSGRQSFGHTYLFVTLEEDVVTTAINTWYFGDFDLDKSFDRYFAYPEDNDPPTCYIGFPSMKDVSWRSKYPHCKSALLIADAKWEWFDKWKDAESGKRGPGYEQFKEALSKQLLKVLYSKVPGTKGKVKEYWLGTPLTDNYYLGSYQGGSYGTRCTTEYFNPKNLKYLMRSTTPIKGLHMAGSDAFCPSVAGAQYGGLLGGLNSIPVMDRFRFARELLGEQVKAIRKIKECSLYEGWRLAIWSNLDWCGKVRPSPRKLRPYPEYCSDNGDDGCLFVQEAQ